MRFANLIKFNLLKKSRLIKNIAEKYSIHEVISPSSFWTLPRIERYTKHAEEKQADYLIRYFVLLAAVGIPVYGVRMIAKHNDNKTDLSKTFLELFLINLIITTVLAIGFGFSIFFIAKLAKGLLSLTSKNKYPTKELFLIFNNEL